MPKKSGFFSLLTGIAVGATAVFLSKKENREKTKKVVRATVAKAKKLEASYKKNPLKVKAELKREGKKLAKKVITTAKKEIKKTQHRKR